MGDVRSSIFIGNSKIVYIRKPDTIEAGPDVNTDDHVLGQGSKIMLKT